MMRGSLQRYGSTLVLVALLEGSEVQSWKLRQPIDGNNEEQLHEMISNLSFMIAHDLPQSTVSAKTRDGLKYYTEALDAYNQYELSGNLDDLSRAGNYSLKAISAEKGYENPFDLLAILNAKYAMIGRYNDGIAYCNKAIKLDPTSVYGWRNKGNALEELGNYNEAIKAYDEAIRLDPNYAATWNSKGIALDELGNYSEAVKAYDVAIRLDPNYVKAWNNKGNALDKLGNYSEAIKAYDVAIRLDPNHVNAWNNKGNALKLLGRISEADVAFAKAKELGYAG
jgi:tetratricopeptide (TPR) repeat protein